MNQMAINIDQACTVRLLMDNVVVKNLVVEGFGHVCSVLIVSYSARGRRFEAVLLLLHKWVFVRWKAAVGCGCGPSDRLIGRESQERVLRAFFGLWSAFTERAGRGLGPARLKVCSEVAKVRWWHVTANLLLPYIYYEWVVASD